eukprot:4804336-Lingulodinium_polyedra.AAC.1
MTSISGGDGLSAAWRAAFGLSSCTRTLCECSCQQEMLLLSQDDVPALYVTTTVPADAKEPTPGRCV